MIATMPEKTVPREKVYTQLGQGEVVHRFPDGTVAVEFPWGGGAVFLPHEIRGISHKGVREYRRVPANVG